MAPRPILLSEASYPTTRTFFSQNPIDSNELNHEHFHRNQLRQARTRKRSTHAKLCPSTSSTTKPLPMIMEEEDEPRTSTSNSYSRSPSPGQYPTGLSVGGGPTVGVKSKRRHANLSVSDIRIAKATLVHDDSDFTQHNSALLSAPRPAPRPPMSSTPSPEPSPDPFSLKFPDGSLRFPHPPIPTPSSNITFDGYRCGSESPTPSMSSCSSTSPESRSTGLPTTPSSSDDEFPSYYSLPLPSFNPRRVSIKPLVITKHNHSSTPDDSLPSISSLLESSKNGQVIPSPFSLEDHSDSEDDSEWYNREFSKILTLCSPPSNFSQKSRPDSVCFPASSVPSPTPTPTSPVQGFPSTQLDPAFPRRRRSRISIPKYPPPPVPLVPTHLRSPPTAPSRPRSNMLTVTPPIRRPPPRSSIPADCVLVDEAFSFSDDSGSAFSFSLYESPSTSSLPAESPKSCYSQQSFQSPQPSPFPSSFPSTPSSFPSSANEEFDFPVDEIEFDMDIDSSMMLPLSLPSSPMDLEADITSGLEQLRNMPQPPQFKSFVGVSDADLFTTGEASSSTEPRTSAGDEDSRELRSRWSSSTLGSIREEHARRSGLGLAASAKLRAYFGGSAPSPKSPKAMRASASSRRSGSVSGAGSAIPLTPLTPTSPAMRFRHARRESDVMAMGYGYQQPLRRRGSLSPSVSDAGSEESASSSGSSGLRRKPIPVEMFLRSAA
ncbi:hypothetical protein DXG03_004006 [Asterophora parasitica]|uniref:Uncharacterized protein n=1 Tax=Asterophora parasitica TaxID=117018 RepID=A0A9P7G317_9AGAR|nr:hypothetical protein DXG03_004006 [Asterophora parasitica]